MCLALSQVLSVDGVVAAASYVDTESDTESVSDSDTVSETEADYDDENNAIIRAKWRIDGSNNLDECIVKLQQFIQCLKNLKEAGWELKQPVDDDYGYIRRNSTHA